MSTSLGGSTGSAGDSFLPATGFGPGSLLVAVLGGVLTLCGVIARRVAGRHPHPAA